MNELLKKIYDNVLVYEKDVVCISKAVEKDVNTLLDQYKSILSEDELEQLKELLYSIALSGEHNGFKIGVRFVLKLLIES